MYLNGVKVNPRFTEGDGVVQSRWFRVEEHWVPFDREAVLAYESTDYREEVTAIPEVQRARVAIEAESLPSGWKKPEGVPRKIDRLAVDSCGRLALLEVKESSADAESVYYAPLQLLDYVWDWHDALEVIWADLQRLIDAADRSWFDASKQRPTQGRYPGARGLRRRSAHGGGQAPLQRRAGTSPTRTSRRRVCH